MTEIHSLFILAITRTLVVSGLLLWIGLGWSGTEAVRPGFAQVPAAANPAERTRHFAAELRDSLKLPGLQIAVAVNGTVLAVENLGFADLERQIPVKPASLFRIGSVSKLLTATAAVRLHQAGKLDLDAPIGRYLTGLPADKMGITPRQLGGHLAGLGHYGRNDYINTTHYRDVTESLERIVAQPLLAAPGSRYLYSSYGFNLLGAVLQRAAGQDFRSVVAEQVSRPLGMVNTFAEDSASPPVTRVHMYSRDTDGAFVDAPSADLTDRWPSGGFLSTAADLVGFGGGLLEASFLKTAERELLFVSQHGADGKETGVGLGWRIARDSRGRRFVHHGGDTVGGRAFVLLYPEQRVAVALLTNLTFAPLGEKEALRFAEPYLPQ